MEPSPDDGMTGHILIAEDEEYLRTFLIAILRRAGYGVTAVENGGEALRALLDPEGRDAAVDLLLTDIKMPGTDGLALVRALRAHGVDIPTVAMTGYGDKEIVVQLLKSGCRDYLEKPFTGTEILTCIERVLQEVAAESESRGTAKRPAGAEASRLSRDIRTYKRNLDRLSAQFDSAVGVYHELVDIPDRPTGIPFAWKNRPLAELGGDFIGIESRSATHDILVADVAGHDIGASFHTVLIKAFFEENARQRNDGPTLFRLLHRHLIESGKYQRMITALFLRIDLEAGVGRLTTAGHPPLIHLRAAADRPDRRSSEGPVLGIDDEADFRSIEFRLAPGDRLFLHTDGVTGISRLDTSDWKMKKLSARGLERILMDRRDLPLSGMVSAVWREVLDFCDGKPGDDMLLAGVEIPARPGPGNGTPSTGAETAGERETDGP